MARVSRGVFRKNMTIVGPRSIGKTSISKDLSKKLLLENISSDDLADKELKKEGGLDNSIKSGKIKRFINDRAFKILKRIYETKNGFVMDLAGGAISSKKYSDVSFKIRNLSKSNSLVIGILPSKNLVLSVLFLFKREIKREHFSEKNKLKLFRKVLKDYLKIRKIFDQWPDNVLYVKGKDLDLLTNEIIDIFEGYKEKWEKRAL